MTIFTYIHIDSISLGHSYFNIMATDRRIWNMGYPLLSHPYPIYSPLINYVHTYIYIYIYIYIYTHIDIGLCLTIVNYSQPYLTIVYHKPTITQPWLSTTMFFVTLRQSNVAMENR